MNRPTTSSYRRRNWLIVCILISGTGLPSITQATLAATPALTLSNEFSPEAATTFDAASQAYTSGDLVAAQDILTAYFKGRRYEIRSLPEANMATDLLSLCERSYSWECGNETRTALSNYYYNILNENREQLADAVFHALFMRWSFVTQTAARTYFQSAPEMAREAIKNRRLDHVAEFMEAEPHVFIDRRLLLTDLYLLTGDRTKARQTIEGALAALLSAQSPDKDPFMFFSKTISVLERLWSLNEHQRITKIVKILSPAAERYLEESSPELFRFRALQSVVALESGDAQGALHYARLQRSFLSHAKLTDAMMQEWTYASASAAWSAALVLGDEASANEAMQIIENNFEVDRSNPLTRIENDAQATALSLSGISRFMFGHRISDRERQLLIDYRKRTKPTRDFGLSDYIDLLLFFDSVDERTKKEKIVQQSKNFLKRIQIIGARDSFDHIPRPLIEVRLASAIFLRIISERIPNSAEAVDLSVGLIDISTRKTSSNDTVIGALLSLAKTNEERFLIRQGFSFLSKKNDFETSQVERIARLLSSEGRTQSGDQPSGSSGSMPPLQADLKVHFIFGDYYRKLQKWRDALQSDPTLSSDAYMANELQIARNIKETDAALIVSTTPDDATYVVCIRPGGVGSLKRASLGSRALRALDKRVSLALTATHSPDIMLDSQFPVAESRQLHEQLISPLLPCIGDAKHLLVSISPDFLLTPFSSFLTADPRSSDSGYDLRTAPWLVRQMSISQQWSPLGLAFVSNSNERRKEKTTAFLGVGDPVLPPVDSPASAVMARIRGGTQGERITLRELPETSEELLTIAKNFSESSELLIRQSSTEADFREKRLSAYKYISFATHGVLREEYEGLSEPALLLTHAGNSDDYNDGLLTASEIGDLDLNADVVTLTACNSASYDLKEFSVGLPSLASAFLTAGAKQVIGTRWAVDSGTASSIAENFYTTLARNPTQRVSEALRAAQLEFIDNIPSSAFAHPRFWAAFSLYGSDSTREKKLDDDESQLLFDSVQTTRNVGEIIAAIKMPHSDLQLGVAIGPADPATQIHSQQLVEISKNDVEVLFQKNGRFFFRTIVARENGNVLTLSGTYVSATETTSITLSEFKSKGSLGIDRPLPIHDLFIQTAKLTMLRDGSVLVVAVGYQPKGKGKMVAIRLSSSLEVLNNTIADLRDGISASALSTGYLGDDILIAVGNANDSSNENNPTPLNLLDHPIKSLIGCAVRHSSLVFGLSGKTFALTPYFDTQDLMITDIAATRRGDLFAVATKGNCFGDWTLTVGTISKHNFNTIFTDRTAIDTRPSKIAVTDHDELVVLGNSQRVIDSEMKYRSAPGSSIDSFLQPYKTVDEKSFLMLFRLSQDGTLVDKKQLVTGNSLFWNDIYRVGANSYRIVGGEPVRGRSATADLTIQ